MQWILIIILVIGFGYLTVLNAKEAVPESCSNLQVSCSSCTAETCPNEVK